MQEVLITLGIIGIVAALTIPILINNSQKQIYVTQLKKAYTVFNQALQQMSVANNCSGDLRCTGIFDAGVTNLTMGDELVKYFKVVKNCQTTGTGCMPTVVNNNYDGTSSTGNYDTIGIYRFITADGMAFEIDTHAMGCMRVLGTGPMAYCCAQVTLDVNGPQKGPNYLGRDVFIYEITNQGGILYPNGGRDYSPHWTTGWCDDTHKNGAYCAGRIIEEGWQMNY